jgi:hypothetical protein
MKRLEGTSACKTGEAAVKVATTKTMRKVLFDLLSLLDSEVRLKGSIALSLHDSVQRGIDVLPFGE